MIKKLNKKQIILGVILMCIIMLPIGNVKAALQANQNTQYTKKATPGTWITNFRQMEAEGSAMGLNETLNSDLTSSSDSNNIDVHMMKTTEYGAIAILSASGYGNPSNENAITSTTGNNTGVILNTDYYEWTAGGARGSIFSGINSRYYDTYETSNASAKIGDALGNDSTTNPGCAGWHSASDLRWLSPTLIYFLRGYGGIFSFDGTSNYSYFCRGVVVCGTGL